MALLQSRTVAGSTAAAATRTNYDYLRKPLRLFSESVNESDPDDIVYVYSVYAPLSVRLVQCVIQKSAVVQAARGGGSLNPNSAGWKGFEDVVKNVGGKTFDEVQKGEDKAVRARSKFPDSYDTDGVATDNLDSGFGWPEREKSHGGLLPGWYYIYGNCCAKVDS